MKTAGKIDTGDPERPKTLGKLAVSPEKYELASIYRAARAHAGISQPQLAIALGRTKKHVGLCELANHINTFNGVDIKRAAQIGGAVREWALYIERAMAEELGAQVIAASPICHGDNHQARQAAIVGAVSNWLMVSTHGRCVGLVLSHARLELQSTDRVIERFLEGRQHLADFIKRSEAAR
jgi:hypothetical protein